MPGMLEFGRWSAFSDSFEPYRMWTLCRDVSSLDLRRGDEIFEVGPGSRQREHWDCYRFQARRPQEADEQPEAICNLEDWQAADLFGGELPPWPLEGIALQRSTAR